MHSAQNCVQEVQEVLDTPIRASACFLSGLSKSLFKLKRLFVPIPDCFLFLEGFQPIFALASLEGMLNSLASANVLAAGEEDDAPLRQLSKAQSPVQHSATLGFLQGFLKLQQAMQAVAMAQDQSQACFPIPFLLLQLEGDKAREEE